MLPKSADIAVIGAQWGDEGKGKIVDALAESAGTTIRFHGGHNAGHTIVTDGRIYKLSLLPSGVVKGAFSVIGSGVVVDPWYLKLEMQRLASDGITVTPERLAISSRASLILPLHAELDEVRERAQSGAVGTTKRGIGPAYEDRVARRAIRVGDLFYPGTLRERIAFAIQHHNILRSAYGLAPVTTEEILQSLEAIAEFIRPYVREADEIAEKIPAGRILFEGAQGIMLDVDQGTYPYVTSSNAVGSHASTGLGIALKERPYVLAVAKAYTTRVGEGPFPTELTDQTGQRLQETGREVGVNTGRSRRCGWIDTVQLRHAALVAGIDSIALTKLDVLDDFEAIKVCTGYTVDGDRIPGFPSSEFQQMQARPVYETLPGWRKSCAGVGSFASLPANAQAYIRRIEELVGVPVSMVSTSPDRRDIILREKEFGLREKELA